MTDGNAAEDLKGITTDTGGGLDLGTPGHKHNE